MNVIKQNELLRKRNNELSTELAEAKKEIERLKADKSKLFEDLQNTEKEWKQIIADLKEQKEMYVVLNRQLVELKDELCGKRK